MQTKQLRPLLTLSCLMLAVVFSACHPTKSFNKLTNQVIVVKDESVDFSKFKTYNWFQENPSETSTVKSPYNTQLAANIRQGLELEMAKRGFTKNTSDPDLLVAFDVSVPQSAEPPAQTYQPGFGYSYSHMLGYRYDYGHQRIASYKPVRQFQSNSLFIDFIDPETKELIWRGYIENVIESYNFKHETVQNLVDDILDKFAKTQ